MAGAKEETHGELTKLNWETLSDNRAKNVRPGQRIYRAALIITGACNFKCPYCNTLSGTRAPTLKKDPTFKLVNNLIDLGLQELRISGGEPTLVAWLPELVKHATHNGVRVAISSNGYSSLDVYQKLIDAGVSDFSISMDSADPARADMLSGNSKNVLDQLKQTISLLSENNIAVYIGMTCGKNKTPTEMKEVVELAQTLGVFEIKIMSLSNDINMVDVSWIEEKHKNTFPLLKWRANNYKNGRDVRGLIDSDCTKCAIVLDDVTIAGKKHYPCNIYFREKGTEIGEVNDNILSDRAKWFSTHNSLEDSICKNNCMDILREYNNRAGELNEYIINL